MKTLFLRLLPVEVAAKGEALEAALAAHRDGEASPLVFEADPRHFAQVPGSPFAYWVGDKVRQVFVDMKPFNSEDKLIQIGLQTSEDFRFLRLWWEINASSLVTGDAATSRENYEEQTNFDKVWVPFVKAGEFAPFYTDFYLVAKWKRRGVEMEQLIISKYPYLKGDADWVLHRESNYFEFGITWPRRSDKLSFRLFPSGCIFSNKGPSVLFKSKKETEAQAVLAILHSDAFQKLVAMQLARTELAQSFEIGIITQTPVPDLNNDDGERLGDLARSSVEQKRALDTANETSHVFQLPALLQMDGDTLAARARAWNERVRYSEEYLAANQREIDAIALRLYGLSADDIAIPALPLASEADSDAATADDDEGDDEDGALENSADARVLVESLLSYALGVAFGRWNARLATGEEPFPDLPDAFAPLPVVAPGATRDGNGLPPRPLHSLETPWMLADDPDSPFDIERHLRAAMSTLFGARASAIELEACALLGIASLRDYFRKPTGFFAFHLARYSKSRRQAPIYWPLSIPSNAFTIWVYAPRLSDQTLPLALTDFVAPKRAVLAADTQRARLALDASPSTPTRRRLDDLLRQDDELATLEADWRALIARPYAPDLNDGALLCAAPMWKQFTLPRWKTALKTAFAKWERGDFDWSHAALLAFPDRVRLKCRSDRSLALAHGLEERGEGTS